MNYKLLIADDEPLVLVGLKSMLNWSELDISVEGLAHNGEELMSMIETVNPDIVITDIKMPVKTGLEVMEECRERYGRLPLFIILTSHEEYSFVKQAISCQAVNYLIKLELNQEVLKETVTEAVGLLRNLKNPEPAGHYAGAGSVMNQLKDRFFVRLLNGLFESQDRFQQQKKDLGIDDRADEYSVCYCEIVSQDMADHEQTVSLYSNVISLVCEAVRQDGYVVSLDLHCFCIIFYQNRPDDPAETAAHALNLVRNYFSVDLRCSLGKPVEELFHIQESFATARMVHSGDAPPGKVVRFEGGETKVFDMAEYREALTLGFQELDFNSLADVLSRMRKKLKTAGYPEAMDAACGILFMARTLLPEGEEIISQIFSGYPQGYRTLYECSSASACCWWMETLQNGLIEEFKNRHQDYRSRIVAQVQRYVDENLDKKLLLSEVASIHGLSQSYLSTLLSRYGGCSFVEYTSKAKVAAAKRMMCDEKLLIQDIAERLGYENAFYFSKVFKKYEGVSPRDYIQQMVIR